QECVEGIRSGAGVSDRAARVATIESKTIDGCVAHEIPTHAECMLALDPGERIAKGDEVLRQRAKGIAAAVVEGRKCIAEINGHVTEGGKFAWADGRTVCGSVRSIEADAAEEAFQGGVAVEQQLLAIETTTNFIDETGGEGVGVRKGNGMVTPLTLRETQTGIFG